MESNHREKVRNAESTYWIWLLISIVLFFVGLAIFLNAPANNIKMQLLGLLITIEGSIWWAVIKIVIHIKLALYRELWDSRNRHRDEMDKIPSQGQ